MEAKILNAFNGLLEKSLEMQELERRVEMMIVTPEPLSGGGLQAFRDGMTDCDDMHQCKTDV